MSLQLGSIGFRKENCKEKELLELISESDKILQVSILFSFLAFIIIAIDHFVRQMYWLLKGVLVLDVFFIFLSGFIGERLETSVVIPYSFCLVVAMVMFVSKK
jgi:hypothetical protein